MIKYSCYLIGEDHLVAECAQILLENNFNIYGIITDFSPVIEWSTNNNIPHFSHQKDLFSVLDKEFDFLISIINSKILKPSVLKLAKKMNINFHNAPLPRYAGLHAISWAILNEEKQHGVTWHEIIAEIDSGDILEQSIFPIEPGETALSLSVKSYEEAINTFKHLLENIKNNSVNKKPQNSSFRNYYSYSKKPPKCGWLQWDDTAKNIQKICRALNLGHYSDNTFLSPKFILDNKIFIATSPPVMGKKSTTVPGSIIKFDGEMLQISTITNDLIFLNLYVIKHPIHKVIEPTQQVYIPKKSEINLYEKLATECSRSEKFWVKELNKFNASCLPFQPLLDDSHPNKYKTICSYKLSPVIAEELRECLNTNIENIILGLISVYIKKLNHTKNISFKMKKTSKNYKFKALDIFFSNLIPLNIPLNENITFPELIERITKNKQKLIEKSFFEYDLFYRYPHISTNFMTQQSIAIYMTESNHTKVKNMDENISIVINIKTNSMSWLIKNNLLKNNHDLYEFLKLFPEQMNHLINVILSDFNSPIKDLTIVTQTDRNKILKEFRAKNTPYPRNSNIINLFEDVVKKNPNKIAITDSHVNFTYKQLNKITDFFAEHLVSLGLENGHHAAICANSEINTIISIIAILKVGAAYVPINNHYPTIHIKNILQDCNPFIFLTNHNIDQNILSLCKNLGMRLIFLDAYLNKFNPKTISKINKTHIDPTQLAYVIYTSGTTGKPKGVMVNHRAIIRLVRNTNYIKIRKYDSIAQAASISFDAATFEIWGALLNGCKLVVIPNATLLNTNKFYKILDKEKITILWLTSSLFNQFATINPGIFKHLTYLLVGGDVLNSERIFNVFDCSEGSPTYIINGYGPTENTTFTTTYKISNKTKKFTSIPIGSPIANTSVYILDKDLNLAPIGVAGELYTGGDGLALGYLNKSDLTRLNFISNPILDFQNETIYKTGDIVRWKPDGNIDYIGRYDNQIKISGFRIEIEGIQTCLLHHPDIQQCFINVLEDEKHIKIIAAYIIGINKLNSQVLKKYLSEKLPAYMIPKVFVFVKQFPLTINGKIDHKKLPLPTLDWNNSMSVLPQTQMQKKLQTLWEELFQQHNIGVTDNFFDIGGHSLLLTHLVVKLKQIFDFDLVIYKFLENPTIETIEALILTNDVTPESVNTQLYDDINEDIHIEIKQNDSQIICKNIFLTGCTGFLGAHLLQELCAYSHINNIYCLVRAESVDEAKHRIEESIHKHQLNDCNFQKIIPIAGDLSKENLGISDDEFIKIAQTIDLIFHNGAQVNHILNYDMLRATNVLATKEIIKLASIFKIKPIYFISTLSAACNHTNANNIKETFIELDTAESPPKDGYSQTKWASEILLTKAQQKGIPIKIYRPGWIIGHSKTGSIPPESNHLYLLIKGCIQLKSAPEWNININLMPVDLISKLIVQTAFIDKNDTVYNLIHPNHTIGWKALFHYLNKHRKYNVALISEKIWKKKYLANINQDNAIYPLFSLYINQNESEWTKELSKITNAHCANMLNTFKKYDFDTYKINNNQLDVYFNYLEKSKFLDGFS
ncbi:MAG: hypothetical protein CK424_07280 [Legionella sp.]|nr:MAG: hypothetical protein CK424_07280 [Legionella sp.]